MEFYMVEGCGYFGVVVVRCFFPLYQGTLKANVSHCTAFSPAFLFNFLFPCSFSWLLFQRVGAEPGLLLQVFWEESVLGRGWGKKSFPSNQERCHDWRMYLTHRASKRKRLGWDATAFWRTFRMFPAPWPCSKHPEKPLLGNDMEIDKQILRAPCPVLVIELSSTRQTGTEANLLSFPCSDSVPEAWPWNPSGLYPH